MGHRLSKIATRTGDDGTTGLGDGSRVDKDSTRIEALGAVDELNSVLGVVLTEAMPQDVRALLLGVQHDLFDLGGELSIPGYALLSESRLLELDSQLEHYNENLPPLKEFILPGGSKASAYCHLARGICRRAERRVVTLARSGAARPLARRYLNRLSDLLFVLCRHLNACAQTADVTWRRERSEEGS